jgi:quinol monooxygenase YgiN
MNNNVYWILELAIKDGELENFRSLMHEMVDATHANEPNTLNYEWTISEDSKTCHIYERYTDSSATMIHMGTFGEKYAERFNTAVEATRCVVYGNPNSEVRDALSGLGPVYMSPFGGFAR